MHLARAINARRVLNTLSVRFLSIGIPSLIAAGDDVIQQTAFKLDSRFACHSRFQPVNAAKHLTGSFSKTSCFSRKYGHISRSRQSTDCVKTLRRPSMRLRADGQVIEFK